MLTCLIVALFRAWNCLLIFSVPVSIPYHYKTLIFLNKSYGSPLQVSRSVYTQNTTLCVCVLGRRVWCVISHIYSNYSENIFHLCESSHFLFLTILLFQQQGRKVR